MDSEHSINCNCNAKGTPAEVVEKLSTAFAQASQTPAVVEYNHVAGAVPLDLGSAEFAKFIDAEIAKWKDLVEKSGATAQ